MDFLELAKKRCSVRKFTEQEIEKDKVLKILEAGRVAPTAKNNQPQKVLVVQSAEGLEKASKGARTYGAKLILIVCADKSQAWVRPYDNKISSDIDASIVTDHMILQATELGLGSVWICYFNPDIIRKEFNIPESLEPINMLAIGYPDTELKSPDRHDTERKPITETVFFEKF